MSLRKKIITGLTGLVLFLSLAGNAYAKELAVPAFCKIPGPVIALLEQWSEIERDDNEMAWMLFNIEIKQNSNCAVTGGTPIENVEFLGKETMKDGTKLWVTRFTIEGDPRPEAEREKFYWFADSKIKQMIQGPKI